MEEITTNEYQAELATEMTAEEQEIERIAMDKENDQQAKDDQYVEDQAFNN